MSDSYKTIKAVSEGIYKEKGSKFLAFAHPVQSEEEVKEIIKEYRKEFYDARHVCYAYVLGIKKEIYRANDDGEPSGTAGRPILGQINSKNLTDVLVVVVRYFGGILLGTGGLVTAYKEASADALNQAEVIENTAKSTLLIRFDYVVMNDVMKLMKQPDVQIIEQGYDSSNFIRLSVRNSMLDVLAEQMKKIDTLLIEP